MWQQHLIAVLALSLLCAAWVLFQRWLTKADPEARRVEDGATCHGTCKRACPDQNPSDQCKRSCKSIRAS